MYNILPQVKALGKKQKLCLYHASTIFTEIKFYAPLGAHAQPIIVTGSYVC